ncbi:hypothetical protein BJY52DRAFT_1184371 [Lactarius psammicola]|nr:hypothetical protein BJY52DRAFT_1184371 [Lactarius psammicola]
MSDYALCHFIEGEDVVSKVIIFKDKDVWDLKEEIHKEGSPSFWNGTTTAELAPDGATEMMDPMQWIQELWPDEPTKRRLHYSPKYPSSLHFRLTPNRASQAIRQKRSIPESVDVHSQLKRTKILDDRPEPDCDIPPIPLLYSGFGHFLDIMGGRDDVPGLADVKVAKQRMAMDGLVTEITMTGFIEDEAERMSTCVYYLGRIFAARQGIEIFKIWRSAIGHNIADNGTTSIVVKFKESHAESSEKLEDSRKLLSDPTAAEIPSCARHYPAISKLSVSKYAASPNADDYLTFEICGPLNDRVYDHLLYKAKRPGVNELILIKFVRRYAIELL